MSSLNSASIDSEDCDELLASNEVAALLLPALPNLANSTNPTPPSTVEIASLAQSESMNQISEILPPEIFKVPLPPPAGAQSLTGLPADIEHIIAMGANEPDEAELIATSNYEKVVRDMKLKAGFGTSTTDEAMDGSIETVVDGLQGIEEEMMVGGVSRKVEEDIVPARVEESDPLGMFIDLSSDKSDSEKSDSSDSESESVPIASTSNSTSDVQSKRTHGKRGGKAKAESDDDISDDDVNIGSAPKTEHESVSVPEMPKLDRVPEGEEIIRFGTVANVIESVVVIKADTAGDWRVLDQGSLCCWEDKTVIGNIFETFGSVQSPFYTLRFPPTALPAPEVFSIGKAVYYAPKLSSFVFTRDIRAFKGSDASNIWDEEVGAGEMEWSDDEQEQEYKKNAKNDRRARSTSLAPTGPKSRQGSRAPAVTPSTLPPMPNSLPARPLVSYSDADVYKPNERPRESHSMGERPPPGREGRQMFERDDGGRMGGGGMGVEYDFDSDNDETGSISSTFEVDERYREIDEMARQERENASRGRGGARGSRGRGGRGNDERGRGRGRGGARGSGRGEFGRREDGSNTNGAREVAGLPRRVSGPPIGRDQAPPQFGFDGNNSRPIPPPPPPPSGNYPPYGNTQYNPQQFNPAFNNSPQQYNPHFAQPHPNQQPAYPNQQSGYPQQQSRPPPPPPQQFSPHYGRAPPPPPFNFNPMVPMGGFNPYYQQPVYSNQSRSFNTAPAPPHPNPNNVSDFSGGFNPGPDGFGYATQQYAAAGPGGIPTQFQQQQNVWRNQNPPPPSDRQNGY